ncbi:MAG: magnesium/cobalt transporter CorA [Alkalinema sp. RU_4_3]|nr:magnesium/cobalt transporter CorA [Alkalinema sp. RU_4_3]
MRRSEFQGFGAPLHGRARGIDYLQPAPGSQPGTLVVTEGIAPEMTLLDYSATEFLERPLQQVTSVTEYLDTHSVSWIDVRGLGHEETLQGLGSVFDLHPLVLEDVVNVPQRPKVEEYDDQLVFIARMVVLKCTGQCDFVTEQVSFVLGEHYLLTVQEEQEHDCFESVRERLRSNKGNIRKAGADYLMYSLIDAVIDGFFPVLEEYGEALELLEDEVVENPSRRTLEKIHRMKRELLTLRRAIWPQRDAINSLIRDGSDLISDDVRIYLRDCYDHTVQVLDMVETYREVASSLMDVYLSSVGNKMNEIMKFLTVMSSLFIPMTFIAGLYGMNFENMPELKNPRGYYICLTAMGAIGIFMLVFFWRKGWFENYSTTGSRRPRDRR